MALVAFFTVNIIGQDSGLPGEDFDLEALPGLFEKVDTFEDLEKAILPRLLNPILRKVITNHHQHKVISRRVTSRKVPHHKDQIPNKKVELRRVVKDN